MSNQGKTELLEPAGISSSSILNICNDMKTQLTKPKIGEFPKASGALAAVKNFLPKLKKAEEDLNVQIENGANVDIEDIEEDSKHIEMNVELFQNNATNTWSEDSEPDSPPSPAERDNAFTSDTDSSSSDSVSSSSSSGAPSEKPLELKIPGGDPPSGQRPRIEELN